MGEGAVLGGHADGVRRPVLPVLVQPLRRAELQEEPPGARHRPTGGDHRGGRHRDTTRIALPCSQEDVCSQSGSACLHFVDTLSGLPK